MNNNIYNMIHSFGVIIPYEMIANSTCDDITVYDFNINDDVYDFIQYLFV